MNDNKQFEGFDRRKEQRRTSSDRREEIRFEPSKKNRRKGHGRRKGELEDIWSNKNI